MNNSVVRTTICCELNKLKYVSESGKFSDIADHICERINEKDSESVILSKIYDVMFFYFSGTHINENNIKMSDYTLFARRIKLTIDKPEGILGELLMQITDLDSQIQEKQCELSALSTHKFKLIKELHSVCSHKEFKQTQLYDEDEYGTTFIGNMERKCLICGFREEAKSQTPWINAPGTYKFVHIVGEPSNTATRSVVCLLRRS